MVLISCSPYINQYFPKIARNTIESVYISADEVTSITDTMIGYLQRLFSPISKLSQKRGLQAIVD